MANGTTTFAGSISEINALFNDLETELQTTSSNLRPETLAKIEELLACHCTVTQAVKARIESWMSAG